MVEIRHKETNEQYSHITFDSILDTSCLKDTDGTMRKSLEVIYNKSNNIFHYQDSELGTRSCKHLSCSLDVIKSGEVEGLGNKLDVHLPGSQTLMVESLTSCCDCDNVLKFREFESDWKIFLDPWFQMLGYDEFTIETYSKCGFGQWTIFWDTSAAQSTDDYQMPHDKLIVRVGDSYLLPKKIKIDEPTHIDSDEFMWFRVGETFIDDNNNEYGKSLITMGIDQERELFDGYSILCPGGTWHGVPRTSTGISIRIPVDDTFFHIQDWYSEEHKKLCEYVKSFTYNVKVIRGSQSNYHWSFVDYSEANSLPAGISGGWYGKGHDENIPKSLEPYEF
jgi:hypothetical protein